MSELSLIIPTKDRAPVLRRTLDHALAAVSDMDAEILVVNDSAQHPPRGIEFESIRLLKNPKQGVASARNLGVKHAQAPYLLFLDDDMLVFKENLERILQHLQARPRSSINLNWTYPPKLQTQLRATPFGRYLAHYGFTHLQGWRGDDTWQENRLFRSAGAASYCLGIRKDVFEETGGYDENFPHAGFEDYAFSERLKEKGIPVFIDPTSTVYHNEADRVTLRDWMTRKLRGGVTRRVGVELGYEALALHPAWWKHVVYRCALPLKAVLLFKLRLLPNARILDPLYFKGVSFLLGLHIYEGYFVRYRKNVPHA